MKANMIIKKIMRDNCLKQSDVADKIGISQQLFSDKIRRNLKVDLFIDVVEALGFKLVVVDKYGRGYQVTK